ncbi:MAG: hypothetical protein NVSMB51_04490 [Solirubrobacteraceae bacterium]
MALETLSLHLLPIAGDGISPAGALLLAGFFNLLVVAVFAPLLSLLLRRRRRDLPRVIARDYAATAALLALAVALVALGVLHRPAVLAGKADYRRQSDAVRRYVRSQAPAYLGRVEAADSWRIDAHLFRTCVPGGARWLCLLVDTRASPPGVTLDPNSAPNSTYIGPAAVGRAPG